MSTIPVGYLIGSLVAAVIACLALWPRPTHGPRVTPALVLAMSGSELPHVFLVLNLLSTVIALGAGDVSTPVGMVALAVSVFAFGAQIRVIALACGTRAAFAGALGSFAGAGGLFTGPGWRDWLRACVAPVHVGYRDVERIRAIPYGPHGPGNLLDLYRARRPVPARGVLIQLHGGGFFSGRRSKEARLLMERFAADGWLCLSADYRLRPAAFPDQLVDGKRVIAWAREHAAEYGGDAGTVVLVGGSAGSHTSVTCALTANDPGFQPGFEEADTRVSAVVGLYGYYGPAPTHGMNSDPGDYLGEGEQPREDVPPVMMVHGDRDPMVAADSARELSGRLGDVSAAPVVYVELPGGHHTLDRFDSLRCCGVVDGIGVFLDGVLGRTPRR
ncbi:MAG: alpha/beta hydrolase [Mycobacteriaceae bacterium]|uniref:alpha/beta hydrolase n=1 Tax=Corynebacterium sp. TaxID=1720 RepID=UPI003F9A661E